MKIKMNINDLINTAFIDEKGIVHRLGRKYNVDVCVVGCQYVKTLFNIEHLEKDRPIEYYQEVTDLRVENWIKANYKDIDLCSEFEKHKRLRG